MYLENLNLIEGKRKKALNDKMLDEYDQRRNAAYLNKQMEDKAERLRRQEDEKRRGWQKALDNQINEKNQLAQLAFGCIESKKEICFTCKNSKNKKAKRKSKKSPKTRS